MEQLTKHICSVDVLMKHLTFDQFVALEFFPITEKKTFECENKTIRQIDFYSILSIMTKTNWTNLNE